MQNSYFGDIHDFYKYYFLKEITNGYSLGIHWCLVPDENDGQGKKPLTSKEKDKDPALYGILTGGKERNVKNIMSYFPAGTRYFDNLHEHYYKDFIYEREAVSELKDQDIIFFDPDNGIEVASMENKAKYKYVSYRLLCRFWEMGKSLIVFQYERWNNGKTDEKIRTLYELTGKKANIITVKKSNITYICMIQGGDHYTMKLVEFKKNREYIIENWEPDE